MLPLLPPLLREVTASVHDIPHVYAMLSNTINGPRIVCVHRVAPCDIGMGMNDNER
jgi:hypothetical protein